MNGEGFSFSHFALDLDATAMYMRNFQRNSQSET